MNRKTLLAISVSAALTAVVPVVHAQQTKPGPYALPPYMQSVEQDRAEVRQDGRDIRNDEQSASQARSTLRSDEAQRNGDLRKLRADERSGNQAGIAQDRSALRQDHARDSADRHALRHDERELRADREERRRDVHELHRDERRVQLARADAHPAAHATRASNVQHAHPAGRRD